MSTIESFTVFEENSHALSSTRTNWHHTGTIRDTSVAQEQFEAGSAAQEQFEAGQQHRNNLKTNRHHKIELSIKEQIIYIKVSMLNTVLIL